MLTAASGIAPWTPIEVSSFCIRALMLTGGGAALTGEQVHWARRGVHALLAAVRPDAVALVDAFGYDDYVLNSALGRHDGDVYRCCCVSTDVCNHHVKVAYSCAFKCTNDM